VSRSSRDISAASSEGVMLVSPEWPRTTRARLERLPDPPQCRRFWLCSALPLLNAHYATVATLPPAWLDSSCRPALEPGFRTLATLSSNGRRHRWPRRGHKGQRGQDADPETTARGFHSVSSALRSRAAVLFERALSSSGGREMAAWPASGLVEGPPSARAGSRMLDLGSRLSRGAE